MLSNLIELLLRAVADLKVKGQLNVGNWRILKVKLFISTIVVCGCFLFFFNYGYSVSWKITYLINPFLAILLIISLDYVFVKETIINYLLHTIGEKTVAKVTFSKRTYGNDFKKYQDFRYVYHDASRKRYKKNISRLILNNSSGFYKGNILPKSGDMIDILYLKGNPKVTIQFVEYSEKKFNLRNGVNNGTSL